MITNLATIFTKQIAALHGDGEATWQLYLREDLCECLEEYYDMFQSRVTGRVNAKDVTL